MCFSARASFFSATLLMSIAIACFRMARNPRELLLAGMPFIFALQQFSEGILWILVPQGLYPGVITFAQYFFLVCAMCVWPLYIPFTIFLFEQERARRALIGLCLALGTFWSFLSLWYLTKGADVTIPTCHIKYIVYGITPYPEAHLFIYSCAVLLPFFITRIVTLNFFGALLGLSCIATYFIWYASFMSVWCFFAALLSAAVYLMLRNPALLK